MPNYIATKMYKMIDDAIRPGGSPSDLYMVEVKNVTLVGSSATIDLTNLIPQDAQVLGYQVVRKATLVSKILTVNAAAAGATDVVDVHIWIKPTQLQQ
jgi:hypothetical protein